MYVVYTHSESIWTNPFATWARIAKTASYRDAIASWGNANAPFASIVHDGALIVTGEPGKTPSTN